MNDKLDDLLENWAHGRKSSDQQLVELARRISSKLSYAQTHRVVKRGFISPRIHIFKRLAYASLGLAAALVVWISLPRNQNLLEESAQLAPTLQTLAGISHSRMTSGSRLFDELDRLFNGDLHWVMESNDDMGMGIEAAQPHDHESPALVRITVLARREGARQWATAWQGDVLLRGQERVEVVPNADPSNKLGLWLFPLEDGKIAVDTSLSLNLAARLTTEISSIITPGEVVELDISRHDDREYRILQSVVFLKEEEPAGACRHIHKEAGA